MDDCFWERYLVNLKDFGSNMRLKNSVKAMTYLLSIFWTIWIIFKSYPSKCFSYFDTYITLITILGSRMLMV